MLNEVINTRRQPFLHYGSSENSNEDFKLKRIDMWQEILRVKKVA